MQPTFSRRGLYITWLIHDLVEVSTFDKGNIVEFDRDTVTARAMLEYELAIPHERGIEMLYDIDELRLMLDMGDI